MQVVEKACVAGGGCKSLSRRLKALEAALKMYLERAQSRPELCEPLSLCELFDMREACLREFRFHDIYQCVPCLCTSNAWLSSIAIWNASRAQT
jgi:hypothetical protein